MAIHIILKFEKKYNTKLRFDVYAGDEIKVRDMRKEALQAAKKIATEQGIETRVKFELYANLEGSIDWNGNGSSCYEYHQKAEILTNEIELANLECELDAHGWGGFYFDDDPEAEKKQLEKKIANMKLKVQNELSINEKS
ncbi:hypothetical protein AB6D04_14240 [Vibrio splendidus]|mgnify:CR=1 FL=1